jgi:prephenate dehydrogenase
MRIAFLGFGLIAGSIARALRAADDAAGWSMAAWSPTGRGPSEAMADGIIDVAGATPAAVLEGADLVVLAGPVPACLAAMDVLADGGGAGALLAPDAVVTDVAGTKATLRRRADELRLRYVGGHPMAGLESAGYRAGRADLFAGRPWVIVPGRVAGPADVARVASLARACGADTIEMDAETHDRAVAGISHLPLVLSAALAEAVAGVNPPEDPESWATASRLAAGGWRDMTRLARGDPSMGSGIMATNAPALAARLRDLRAVLDRWQAELDSPGDPDVAAIEERLRAARARLDPR